MTHRIVRPHIVVVRDDPPAPYTLVSIAPQDDGNGVMVCIQRTADGQQACVALNDDDFGGPPNA